MARQDCQMWAGTVHFYPRCALVGMWTWWRFVLMSCCQVWLLFKEHYVWISNPNELPFIFSSIQSLLHEKKRWQQFYPAKYYTISLWKQLRWSCTGLGRILHQGMVLRKASCSSSGDSLHGSFSGSVQGDLGLLKGWEAASSCAIWLL